MKRKSLTRTWAWNLNSNKTTKHGISDYGINPTGRMFWSETDACERRAASLAFLMSTLRSLSLIQLFTGTVIQGHIHIFRIHNIVSLRFMFLILRIMMKASRVWDQDVCYSFPIMIHTKNILLKRANWHLSRNRN